MLKFNKFKFKFIKLMEYIKNMMKTEQNDNTLSDNDTDTESDISFYKILDDMGDHKLCEIIDYNEFISNTKIWKGNRNQDSNRITEIVNSIKSQKLQPSIIYISEINGKLRIWEGQHRFSAVKKYIKDNSPDDNIIKCFKYFFLFLDDTNNNIKVRFNNINKAVPVANIYTDSDLKDLEKDKLILLCKYIIDKLIQDYPSFVSTSFRCRRPNFNRDILEDVLSNYIRNNKLFDINKELLWNKIIELNEKYKKGIHINLNGLSTKVLDKCREEGLYLFACTKDFVIDLTIK